MPRKRMIDPGIWDSEQVQSLTTRAFKTYVYLISNADDAGRLKATWALFPSRIFPFGGVTAEEIRSDVATMQQIGLIEVYGDERTQFISHPNWTRYQVINHPSKVVLPAPEEYEPYDMATGGLPEDSRSTPIGLTPNLSQCSVREESRGAEAAAAEPLESEPPTTTSRTLRKPDPKDQALQTVSPEDRSLYAELHAGFERKQPGKRFADYGREGKSIKRLIDQAHKYAPDSPREWLFSVIGEFKRLRSGPDDYWQKQPFLPSVLSGGGILPRVLESLSGANGKDLGNVAAIEEALHANE